MEETELHGAFGEWQLLALLRTTWGDPGNFRRFARSAILSFSVELRVTFVEPCVLLNCRRCSRHHSVPSRTTASSGRSSPRVVADQTMSDRCMRLLHLPMQARTHLCIGRMPCSIHHLILMNMRRFPAFCTATVGGE